MIKFIAEIGSNHNQLLPRCKKLIETAKEIGCGAVKFQLFKADKLYAPGQHKNIDWLRQCELPYDFIPSIKKICIDNKIDFGCSVFDLEGVEYLKSFVDFLKIGSYELTYQPLIDVCKDTKLPIIFSSGMCTWPEILNAIKPLKELSDYSILHCVSEYPARPVDCNLKAIKTMNKLFFGKIGWSDHTKEPGVIYRAVGYGAKIIEFHLDSEDKKGMESKFNHCWIPSEIELVIKNIRIGEIATGNGIKEPTKTELILKSQRMDENDGMRPIKSVRI